MGIVLGRRADIWIGLACMALLASCAHRTVKPASSSSQAQPDSLGIQDGSTPPEHPIIDSVSLWKSGEDSSAATSKPSTSEGGETVERVLKDAVEQAFRASLEGDWQLARSRWEDLRRSREPLLSALEEAEWGLILAQAVASSRDQALKARLKDLNEKYFREADHSEISKLVLELLERVQDGNLRKEIKKLSNRSWEREQKAGKPTPDQKGSSPASGMAAEGRSVDPLALPVDLEAEASIRAEADSLLTQGRYLLVLAALERLDKERNLGFITERKQKAADRFCEEKRRLAAESYRDFKRVSKDTLKLSYLRKSAAELDSCLLHFPDAPIAGKVRGNREMVDADLRRLGGGR